MQELNQENSNSSKNGTDELLANYVKGWSDADPEKIAAAAADEYAFHDPIVGRFSKRDLLQYFALLRARFLVAAPPRRKDVGFSLHGPMFVGSKVGCQRYWREAPLLGLTGDSEIRVTGSGIAAESVAYDLNMASEVLRKPINAHGLRHAGG